MKTITAKFNKVNSGAIIPTQVEGSAGLDMYACFEDDYRVIPSHTTKLVPTGVRVALPEGYFMLLEERGSTGSKGIKRSAGVVDNDYRGEIFAAITNSNDYDICIYKNDPVSIEGMYSKMMEEASADDKEWSDGVDPENDAYRVLSSWMENTVSSRFDTMG